MKLGKIPYALLDEFLKELPIDDPRVIVRPSIGEDTSAVSIAEEDVIVLKSDPITFATDSIGYYAVTVNANDIAASGAAPQWFLSTILLPKSTEESTAERIMNDIRIECSARGIALCGGHTEITDAVTRPVVCGMMIGTVPAGSIIEKKNMETGDKIIMTKGAAVEGTAVIAGEFFERLQRGGISESSVRRYRGFLKCIGIQNEAGIAVASGYVSAMHDVTEGGVSTALTELSSAGRHVLAIDVDSIPILSETRQICDLLELDPLGLIGSGSLIICCKAKGCKELIRRLDAAGIAAAVIGEVGEEGEGILPLGNSSRELPIFEVDEITKLYS